MHDSMFSEKSINMTNSQVWFRGVRSSKFRHVYGVPFKRERCYDNIKITRNAHDSNFCAVNPKFVAIVTEVAGGGAFLVLPLDHTGRLDFNASRVTGHKGPVLDIKWNPFNDNIIASCSDDCTVKLWHIPDGGLSMHLMDWLVELHGHKRRVAYIEWHPTAENILLSAGFDYLIFVWDVGKGEAIKMIDCHSDVIYCMSFNRDGSLLATTSKDKKLRVIEPRSGIVLSEGQCHTGTKASKCTFLGSQEKVLTTGFSRYSDRQYAVWDQHDLSKPLACETIDSSSGVVFPYYDYDTNMVYLAGKGDGNIRYYEVVDEPPYVHFLNQFLSGNPQRGLGIMPKRGVNTGACEVFRLYKLHTSRSLCEPISMIVPRKSDCFQEDLYPDTAAPLPALSARDWMSGRNSQPLLISMKTGVTISTHKPRTNSKETPALQPQDANNRKKFAFLSRETTPDYRPLSTWHQNENNHDENNVQIQTNEKSQKTNANQNTKFHQLQRMFGKQAGGDSEPVPLYKQINQGDVFSTEHESVEEQVGREGKDNNTKKCKATRRPRSVTRRCDRDKARQSSRSPSPRSPSPRSRSCSRRIRELEMDMSRERDRLQHMERKLNKVREMSEWSERSRQRRSRRPDRSPSPPAQRRRLADTPENEGRNINPAATTDEQPLKRLSSPTYTTADLVKIIKSLKDVVAQPNQTMTVTKSSEHRNTILEFNPSTQRIDVWLKEVNDCVKKFGWDDTTTVRFAMQKLQGSAKTWYEGLSSIAHTWAEWQGLLANAFSSEINYGQSLEDMLERKSRFNEPLDVYFYEKLALLNQVEITGKRAVDCLIHGLTDNTMKSAALSLRCTDPDQLLQFLMNYKESNNSERSFLRVRNFNEVTNFLANNENNSFTPETESGSKGVSCYNCKGIGHPYSRCPMPVVRCRKCNKVGHNTEECSLNKDVMRT